MAFFRIPAGLVVWLAVAGLVAAQEPTERPVMIKRVAPEYPQSLRAQRVIGRAELVCTVDETGQPTKILITGQSQPAFGEAAQKALAQCLYRPGTKDGRPQPMKVGVTMDFSLTDEVLARLEAERSPEVLPPGPPVVEAFEVSEMPELKKEIRPVMPGDLRDGPGIENAVVRFQVDEGGVPRDVHLLVTTSASCGPAAVAAVRQWRFVPGKREAEIVRVNMEVPIAFFRDNKWASGARIRPGVSRDIVSALPGHDLAAFTGKTDEDRPQPQHRERLKYPNEMAGFNEGTVLVECIINPYGVVTHVRAIDTTNQYFTIAAERCFSRWRFSPPRKNGQPVYLRGLQRATFELVR